MFTCYGSRQLDRDGTAELDRHNVDGVDKDTDPATADGVSSPRHFFSSSILHPPSSILLLLLLLMKRGGRKKEKKKKKKN